MSKFQEYSFPILLRRFGHPELLFVSAIKTTVPHNKTNRIRQYGVIGKILIYDYTAFACSQQWIFPEQRWLDFRCLACLFLFTLPHVGLSRSIANLWESFAFFIYSNLFKDILNHLVTLITLWNMLLLTSWTLLWFVCTNTINILSF